MLGIYLFLLPWDERRYTCQQKIFHMSEYPGNEGIWWRVGCFYKFLPSSQPASPVLLCPLDWYILDLSKRAVAWMEISCLSKWTQRWGRRGILVRWWIFYHFLMSFPIDMRWHRNLEPCPATGQRLHRTWEDDFQGQLGGFGGGENYCCVSEACAGTFLKSLQAQDP